MAIFSCRSAVRSLAILASFLVFGCTSTSPSPSGKFQKSTVIERSGDREKTPDWAKDEGGMALDGSDVVFVNKMTMSGESRPEACVKAAEETGRAAMLRYISDHITTSGQVSEVSATSDPAVESLTAYLSQGKISGVKAAARYWEKREESDPSGTGERVLRIWCFAKMSVEKSVLQRQMNDALGNGRGNPEIRAKLLDAQKNFIEGIGKTPTE